MKELNLGSQGRAGFPPRSKQVPQPLIRKEADPSEAGLSLRLAGLGAWGEWSEAPSLLSFYMTAWPSNKRAVLERLYGAVKSFRQWFNWGRLKCPPQEGLPFKGQPGLAPLPSAPLPSAPPPMVALPPASPFSPSAPQPLSLGLPADQGSQPRDPLASLSGGIPSWPLDHWYHLFTQFGLVAESVWEAEKAESETQRAPEQAHPETPAISLSPREPSLVSGPTLQLPYQLLSPGPSPVWNFMVTVRGLP